MQAKALSDHCTTYEILQCSTPSRQCNTLMKMANKAPFEWGEEATVNGREHSR